MFTFLHNMDSTVALGTAKLIGERVGHVLFFPVWWYTRGLLGVLRYVGRSIKNHYEGLALGVWLANLFVPMYGTTDWAGRLISFLIRLFMIVARGLLLFLWILIMVVLLVFYLLLLPVTIIGLVYHLTGAFFSFDYVF